MFNKTITIAMILTLKIMADVSILHSSSSFTTTSTFYTGLSKSWYLTQQCKAASNISPAFQITTDDPYWGIYATKKLTSDSKDTLDTLDIGCYYRFDYETRFRLFASGSLKNDLDSIRKFYNKKRFEHTTIPGPFQIGLADPRRDTLDSYIRTYKLDSMYVIVAIPNSNKVKIYKNYMDDWNLKTTITTSGTTTLLDFKFQNNCAYFSSNGILYKISSGSTYSQIATGIFGYFLDLQGIWTTNSSGQLLYNNVVVKTNSSFAVKKFAVNPVDTTFFSYYKINNSYYGDVSCSEDVASYNVFLDSNNNISNSNRIFYTKSKYTRSCNFPRPLYDFLYKQNSQEITYQISDYISIYKFNNTPFFLNTTFVDSLGYTDESTKRIYYTDTLHAFEYLNNPLTFTIPQNPLGLTIVDSIISLNSIIQPGSYEIKFRTEDSYSKTDSIVWNLKVFSRKISINESVTTSATEGTQYSQVISTTDIDNDSSFISYSKLPSWLSISRTSKNQFTISGTPTHSNLDTTITLILTDNSNYYDAFQKRNLSPSYDTLIYSLTITKINVPPTFTSTPITTGIENQLYTYQANATDEQPITYSLKTAPANMTISSTGLVSWIPVVGTYGVSVVAKDSENAKREQNFMLVISQNNAPIFTSTPITTGIENQLYTYQVQATDEQTISYSLLNAPTNMTIFSTGLVTWTPSLQNSGSYSITIIAKDSYNTTSQQNYTLVISNVNVAPVITTILKDTTITETDSLYFTVSTSDFDGTLLSTKWYLGSTLVSENSTCKITTNYTSAGIQTLKVVVSDGEVSVEKQAVITILDKNRLPIIPSDTTITIKSLNQPVTINAKAIDPDGDKLIYTYDTTKFSVTNLVVTIKDSIYSITLKKVINDTLTFTISDGKSKVSFTVKVISNIPTTSVISSNKTLCNSFNMDSKGIVKYSVAKQNNVQLVIYSLNGKILYKNDRNMNPGCYNTTVHATTGTYLYQFKIGKEFSTTNRIQIVK
jgi:hypothetical protein